MAGLDPNRPMVNDGIRDAQFTFEVGKGRGTHFVGATLASYLIIGRLSSVRQLAGSGLDAGPTT